LNLSENKQADIEQKRAEKRLREAETGNYDFKVNNLALLPIFRFAIFFLAFDLNIKNSFHSFITSAFYNLFILFLFKGHV